MTETAAAVDDRESMDFDVVIVGAGPAGLAAAIRLKQLDVDLNVVVPMPDGELTFDWLTSVFLSNANHDEDRPVHLGVADPEMQKQSEYAVFSGPSARYCPVGVYEWVEGEDGKPRFQINAANCVHLQHQGPQPEHRSAAMACGAFTQGESRASMCRRRASRP